MQIFVIESQLTKALFQRKIGGVGMWLVARDSSILGEETFLSRLCNLEDFGNKN